MLEVDDAVHLGYTHVSSAWQDQLLHFDLLKLVKDEHFFDVDVQILQNIEGDKRLDFLYHIHNVSRKWNREQKHVDDYL